MSFSAEAYYLPDHDGCPLVVHHNNDVDALIDALLGEPFERSMANLYIVERPKNAAGMPGHEFGVAVNAENQLGGLWYMGEDGSWYSQGDRSLREEVFYFYRGHVTDFPVDSEIPLSLIRQATNEFLASGGERPTCVRWQPYRQVEDQ